MASKNQTIRVESKKQLTTKHMLLIVRIKKEMIQDELNHNKQRLIYTHEWVHKFFERINLRGKYTKEEGNVLTELRNFYITELEQYKSW